MLGKFLYFFIFYLREDRLDDLAAVFGIEENVDSSVKISYYIDFVD